jgi:hypothetical protein
MGAPYDESRTAACRLTMAGGNLIAADNKKTDQFNVSMNAFFVLLLSPVNN